jgi:hypothetical protein
MNPTNCSCRFGQVCPKCADFDPRKLPRRIENRGQPEAEASVPLCGTCDHFHRTKPTWCLGAHFRIAETDYCSQHTDAVAERKGGAL